MTEAEIGGLIAFGFGTLVTLLIVIIVPYIFGAIGLYSMAQRDKIEFGWLAFIPVGNTYIIGELIHKKLTWFTLGNSGGVKLLIIYIGSMIISFIPVVGALVTLIVGILGIVVLYWLFEKYTEKAAVLTIISVITAGIVAPFIIFGLRKKETRY